MQETQNDCLCHIGFRTSSRARKYTATNAYKYINRLGKDSKKEDLIYANSINMPEWAENNPKYFWQMAAKHESFQGRQAININVALPNELSQETNIKLMNEFVQSLTTHPRGQLPCSYGFHFEMKNDIPNPHFHLMLYERPLNEVSSNHSAEQYFKKANRTHSEAGGIKKITFFKKAFNIKKIRKLWADLANKYLEKAESIKRMNPLSYADRGLLQMPQIHLGSKSSHQKKEGKTTMRIEKNEYIKKFNEQIEDTDWIEFAGYELAFFVSQVDESNRAIILQLEFAEKERLFNYLFTMQRAMQEKSLQELLDFYLEEYKELEITSRLERVIKYLVLDGFNKDEILEELLNKKLDIEAVDLSFAYDVFYYDLIVEGEWIDAAVDFIEAHTVDSIEELLDSESEYIPV